MITEQEFTNIYHLHAQKIYRVCVGYASGDKDLANEWLQETFIKVWKYRETYKGLSSIETWIYRIAVNVCLNDLRKMKKNMPINEEILSNSIIFDDSNYTEEHFKKMFECIDKLTYQNKTLILLELENLPQTTIAATVGIAHGALRTRLSRIKKSLLKCIQNGK